MVIWGEVQEAAAGKSKDATNEDVDGNDIEAEKEEKALIEATLRGPLLALADKLK